MWELEVSSSFSAAHRLCGYGQPCENVHGHNWKVIAVVRCEKLDAIGIGYDFKALRTRLREILAALDHQDLNATPPFDKMNPSAENLARWVFERLSEKLAESSARVARIVVRENEDSGATFVP
ncbi:MAG: 6-carboxytetrahydropterin synthase [Deltaproteobacteria bacterium]|nr:6-carboxytetrahydropterin synthase [Deltaproteobacteria bacterium]